MIRNHLINAFSILIGIAVITASCNKNDEITITDYQIFVDSIATTDTIPYGGVFLIKFYGFVGATDCYLFQNFNVDMPGAEINISVIGGYTEDQECDSVAQYLAGESLKIYDLPAGEYFVSINQPRDLPIKSVLHVVEE